jgi:hypothetical protein
MKSKASLWSRALLTVLAVGVATIALAQSPNYRQLRELGGVLNDYTPATATTNSPSGTPSVAGPWEVRGHWQLVLKDRSEKADFSAALNMERSDAGVALSGGGDFNNPVDRSAHTHHITLLGGDVTPTATGFQVTGPATITKDGAFPPPFGSTLPILTIEVTGGTGDSSVRFSNITVLFGAPAAGHFGMAPLHGVVHLVQYGDNRH